jgi:hypothetical protein
VPQAFSLPDSCSANSQGVAPGILPGALKSLSHPHFNAERVLVPEKKMVTTDFTD